MKISEIRELSISDIEERLEDEKQALAKLKFQHSISSIENPLHIRAVRRDIARLSTELTARRNEEKKETNE